MTPFQFAIMAGVFLIILMSIMVVMFFFSISYGGKKLQRQPFGPLLQSFAAHYEKFPEIPGLKLEPQILDEAIRTCISEGSLIRAKHLAIVRGEVCEEKDFALDELREVLLPDILRMKNHITPELFAAHIAHPLIQSHLTPIFASISRPLLRYSAQNPINYNLKPEKRAGNHHVMDTILGYHSRVSRLALTFEPELYFEKDLLIEHANTTKIGQWFPSIALGNEFLDLPENEQLFMLASKAALFRPELRILLVFPTEAEFMEFGSEIVKFQTDEPSILMGKIFRTLQEEEAEVVQARLKSMPELDPFELNEWRRGAILTAHRIGWILVDRWPEIKRVLMREGHPGTIDDLLHYMISDSFLITLGALGVFPGETVQPSLS
ncbi:hypothetical protein KKF84_02620 [Myxococcota bacterium]|nr:hypothetical protein [Myxococcota bacterium]MBU1534183.1 hypothetical protein [Myxococcota bacterium]